MSRLIFDDYSVPDPDIISEVHERIWSKVYYSGVHYELEDEVTLTKKDLVNLLSSADTYLHFLCHPSKGVINQLKEIRNFLQK